MDVYKLMPLIASVMSNEELANKAIEDATKYLENPCEDTFSSLEFTATLIATKKAVNLAGGVDLFNAGLENARESSSKIDPRNLKASDN